MQRSSGSAEQPANDMEPAEYMTGAGLPPPGIDEISSGRPAGYCDLYRLAFHNIGWIKASKKKRHTMENLGTEMCDMPGRMLAKTCTACRLAYNCGQ